MNKSRRKKVERSFAAVALIAMALALLYPGCGSDASKPPGPVPTGEVIVRYEVFGGLVPPWADRFPQFILYGDGTVIRNESGDMNGLMVEGKLDGDELEELLTRFKETGFFELEDEYTDVTIMDGASQELSVSLDGREKTVLVYMEDVKAFDEAVDLLLSCPLGEVRDYVPEEGYLVVEGTGDPGLRVAVDPSHPVYSLLPPPEELEKALEEDDPIALKGDDFAAIKAYEADQERPGLLLDTQDGIYILFPVYQAEWSFPE